VRGNLRRVLRSRGFFAETLADDTRRGSAEHIYVAQGRDRVLLVVRDASQQQDSMSHLQRLAFVDEATGLPNHEYFQDELQRVCEHQRLREGRAAVICIHIADVDGEYASVGPNRYRAALQVISQGLLRELRGANAVHDDDFERRTVVARIDYHRIGIILPEIETGADAESVAERLVQRTQAPVEIDGKRYVTHVYAGIGLFPQDGDDANTLFQNSNAATDEARAGEPGNILFHSGTMKLRTLARQDLEVELKVALDTGAFALNYLPIVDAAGHEVRAIEALLRWPDSILGSHSTSKIIGLAERTGLIVKIGEWVMREAFGQLRAWQDAGNPNLRLAINISMQEFSRPDIADRMAAAIVEAGIQPGDVDLEVTEKMLARDALAGFQVLDALHELGVRLIVDDYGTVACSLAQLAHSPVAGIKLDNSLVAGLVSCDRDRAACNAAIAGAHSLDLLVTGEGVESREQASILSAAGCDLLQGFYFTQPLAPDDVHTFIASVAGNKNDD
jgi:EAL domain-containing protein (putative c-di-GMP-specific phosphodiesterase class I)/GGDEF domain-containing protein